MFVIVFWFCLFVEVELNILFSLSVLLTSNIDLGLFSSLIPLLFSTVVSISNMFLFGWLLSLLKLNLVLFSISSFWPNKSLFLLFKNGLLLLLLNILNNGFELLSLTILSFSWLSFVLILVSIFSLLVSFCFGLYGFSNNSLTTFFSSKFLFFSVIITFLCIVLLSFGELSLILFISCKFFLVYIVVLFSFIGCSFWSLLFIEFDNLFSLFISNIFLSSFIFLFLISFVIISLVISVIIFVSVFGFSFISFSFLIISVFGLFSSFSLFIIFLSVSFISFFISWFEKGL